MCLVARKMWGEKARHGIDCFVVYSNFDECGFGFAETVYHSSSILSNLSSSWTSKPPLAVKYQMDTGSLEEPGGPKSLCSTLERLLAWEKKLYEEVKVINFWDTIIFFFFIIEK